MMTFREIKLRANRVQDFENEIEILRKLRCISDIEMYFNGYPAMRASRVGENFISGVRQIMVSHQLEIVSLNASLLRGSNIDPGDWRKEFET